MKTLTTFIIGIVVGILLLYASDGSLRGALNSGFLETVVIATVGYFIYKKIGNKKVEAAISVIPDTRNSALKIANNDRSRVYLWGYDIPGLSERFTRPRLIPYAINPDSYYWISLPQFKDVKLGESFDLKLFIEDELGKRYVSEHGVLLDKHQFQDGAFTLKTWPYKLEKKAW